MRSPVSIALAVGKTAVGEARCKQARARGRSVARVIASRFAEGRWLALAASGVIAWGGAMEAAGALTTAMG